MAWILLIVAGLLEVGWVLGLKYGMLYPWRGILAISVVVSIGSILLLALAMKGEQGIPMGTAYAVWTGIGTIGAAVLGMILFKEDTSILRWACIGLILLGIIGLKLTRGASDAKPTSDAQSPAK